MFGRKRLAEEDVYDLLANRRRRQTLRHLETSAGDGTTDLGELAAAIAVNESGRSPPPSDVRESVYNSLNQTHLPKLEELGVVQYDRDARTVRLRERVREVDPYMDLHAVRGVTWSEIYRSLGVGSLLLVTASLAEVPVVGAVDPLLWASAFLLAFAVATAWQLWTNRWYVRRALGN